MGFSAPKLLQEKWPLFKKYGATRACVYQSMNDSEYTDGNVSKSIASSHNIDIIFDKIKTILVDGETIRSIDRVAIFPTLDLPVVSKVNDLIVDPSLRQWEVKDLGDDPMGAHQSLRVRPIT